MLSVVKLRTTGRKTDQKGTVGGRDHSTIRLSNLKPTKARYAGLSLNLCLEIHRLPYSLLRLHSTSVTMHHRSFTRVAVYCKFTSKKRRSPKKVPWTSAEDLALVQYIALHKDEQATTKRVASHESRVKLLDSACPVCAICIWSSVSPRR